MTEVKLHTAEAETPKTAGKPGTETETDSLGRIITVRKIGPLDRMRLFKVVGPVNVKNDFYLGMATTAYSVSAIDGDAVPPPATELQLEALVSRLGEEGIEAVNRAVQRQMGLTEEIVAEAGGDLQEAIRIVAKRRDAEATAASKN